MASLLDEEAVLIRFREGSREAFEWLVRQYREPAVRFAYHLTGDYHTAEDLAQDCFAYLLVYPEKYDYRASFKNLSVYHSPQQEHRLGP
ncbi:RNA polymerase sigma factor [Paenibacillus rhizoplanae]